MRIGTRWLASAAMVGALLTTMGSAASSAEASSSSPGAVVVEGQLTGSPWLGGVKVALYAEPPQPFMAKLHQGDRFPMQLVGSTTSLPTGAYAITMSHPNAIKSSEYNGIVNLWIMAAGPASCRCAA